MAVGGRVIVELRKDRAIFQAEYIAKHRHAGAVPHSEWGLVCFRWAPFLGSSSGRPVWESAVGWGVPIRALQSGCAGSQEGLLVSRECSLRLRECPILAQIDCFKRAPVSSLEEPCSDSRGCQVLAPGESLL